jgi:hypothetical protein
MSTKKPFAMNIDRNGKHCPVCGKRSYSLDGVHPQCAMLRADEPRKLRLAAEKKAKEAKRS